MLTARHLFDSPRDAISIRFPDGQRFVGNLVADSRDDDVAAVRIASPRGITPVAVSTSIPRPGDVVHYAGYGGAGYRLARCQVTGYCHMTVQGGQGVRSANERDKAFTLIVKPNARPGDSGAMILNRKGELVAVLSCRHDGLRETLGTYCGRINQLGYEWAQQRLLPWNSTTDQAKILADAQREQALIGLAGRSQIPQPMQMTPMVAPGAAVDVEARARLSVVEGEVAIGREIVQRLGLVEADAEQLDGFLAAGIAEAQTVAEEAVAAVAEIADDSEAVAELENKQETTDGWLWGLLGTAIASAVPGGGALVWIARQSRYVRRLKDRVEGRVDTLVDRLPAMAQTVADATPTSLGDAQLTAFAETIAAKVKAAVSAKD